jgi:hypothetical protein
VNGELVVAPQVLREGDVIAVGPQGSRHREIATHGQWTRRLIFRLTSAPPTA